MLCANCGKRPAAEYTKNKGGKTLKLYLCPSCYELLYSEKREEADLFSSYLNGIGGERKRKCPVCDTTLGEFKSTGLLGCAYCYTAFREELTPTIYYIQGATRYKGEPPKVNAEEAYDTALRRERLKAEFDRAVRSGDSARAEALKAEIIELNRFLDGSGGVK